MSFLGGSVVKKLPANARDSGSIPGSGRSPGEGNGNRLQGSCLGNPTDRVSSWATVHMVEKRWTWPSTQGHTHRGVYGGDKVDLSVTLHVCVQEIYKVSEFIHFRQRDQVIARGQLAASPLRVTFPKWLAGLLLRSVHWREKGSPACSPPPSEGGGCRKPTWYFTSSASHPSRASTCDSSHCFRPAHPPQKPLPFQKPQIPWTGISGDGIKTSGLNTTFLQVILMHDQLK